MRHQTAYYGFDESSRVFDFASASFDVGWTNPIYTFAAGACLLVPSEEQRKNDFAATMESMGTTHVDLTPWAASVLPLSTIANLRTLLLEGEKVRLPDVLRWSEHARVVNFYGPSECTPNSTVATYTGTNTACFGYLTSGRDAPIRGLNDSVGAYTNVLICQLDSLWAKEPHELVQEVLRQMLEDTDFQHCPLANIQQALDLAPGQQLYNSLLSIQRLESPQSSSGKTPCLTFTAIDGQDPTEYDIAPSVGLGDNHSSVVLDVRPSLRDSATSRSHTLGVPVDARKDC